MRFDLGELLAWTDGLLEDEDGAPYPASLQGRAYLLRLELLKVRPCLAAAHDDREHGLDCGCDP